MTARAASRRQSRAYRALPAIYLVLGVAWIFGSDVLLDRAVGDEVRSFLHLSVLKGVLFIVLTTAVLALLVRENSATALRIDGADTDAWRPVTVFVVASVAMAFVGLVLYGVLGRHAREETIREITELDRLRAEQISAWHRDRMEGLDRAFRRPLPRMLLSLPEPNRSAALQEWLEALQLHAGPLALGLFTESGLVVANAGQALTFDQPLREALAAAPSDGSALRVVPRTEGDESPLRLDYVARLPSPFGGTDYVFVARLDFERFIRPVIGPAARGSKATYLIERDTRRVLFQASRPGEPFLPRHDPTPAEQRRLNWVPDTLLTGSEVQQLPAAFDTDASSALVAGQVAAGTPWALVTVLDLEAVRGPMRMLLIAAASVGTLILGLAALVTHTSWRAEKLRQRLRLAQIEAHANRLAADRDRAERADTSKSVFLRTVSHDMRSSLNSIVGFTDLLLAGLPGPTTEEQQRQLGMVQDSARHMVDLINDVLDWSSLEEGRLKLELRPVELVPLLLRRLESFEPQAVAKGLELRHSIDAALGTVETDSKRLTQVVTNLLSNAIKFTGQGTVTLSAARVGQEIVITVRDTGAGIPEEVLARIFEPYYQAREARVSTEHGTGLGLSITRGLVRALGGEIAVESTLGVGTLFTVRLPTEIPLASPWDDRQR